MLPAERHLHESMFRRRDGIHVLVATSTLAQGMNLPSEIVVIAGDDRFDANAGRAKQLEAHELLNAAGRAGRAGEAAQALVIVIPGKVINFDDQKNLIHRHWFQLQTIFAKSDQCLDIEDPVSALLDQIQLNADLSSGVAGYFLSRLPVGEDGDDEPARRLLQRSLAAFQAKRRGDNAWVQSRIQAAMERRRSAGTAPSGITWHDRLAAASGVAADLIRDLDRDMHASGEDLGGTVEEWIEWFFEWLSTAPRRADELIRPSNLQNVFGSKYAKLPTEEARCRFALERLRALLPLWVHGSTLRDLEIALGSPANRLGHCERARAFALRLVPDVAYSFGLVGQVHRHRLAAGSGAPMPLILATLGGAVRDGFDSPEKLALYRRVRRNTSRVGAHRLFEQIQPHLFPGGHYETFREALQRVDAALRI